MTPPPPPHPAWPIWTLGAWLVYLCKGLTTRQPLWVTEKGRKEIEEIVEEMKETIREEIGTGMKVKKLKTFPLYPYLLALGLMASEKKIFEGSLAI